MFEALFILTTIDTGTRIARFVMQEFLGKLYRPLERTDWVWGTVVTSGMTVIAWGFFIYTGSVATIWPMFGIANQLLAVIALCLGTMVTLHAGRGRYAWVTLAPMLFVAITTTSGAVALIRGQFLPWTQSAVAADVWRGVLDIALTVVLLICLAIILGAALLRWWRDRFPVVPLTTSALVG
jgi:carbon starvation protein